MSAGDPGLLRQAAQIIRDGGLCKGSSYESDGSHCTVGAVGVAMGFRVAPYLAAKDTDEVKVLAQMLGSRLAEFMPAATVALWNDQPERTADEVVELFEQAAEKLEANR